MRWDASDTVAFRRLLPKVVGATLLLVMAGLCMAMTVVGMLW